MKFRKIAIGSALSVSMAVSVFALAAGGGQMGGSQMGGGSHGPSSMERMEHTARMTNRVQSRAAIQAVQQKLNAEGYSVGKADGIWGPHSAAALKRYQQDKGLAATGRLDQDTANGLGLEQAEFAAFENAIGQKTRSRMEQKEQTGKPGGDTGGM